MAQDGDSSYTCWLKLLLQSHYTTDVFRYINTLGLHPFSSPSFRHHEPSVQLHRKWTSFLSCIDSKSPCRGSMIHTAPRSEFTFKHFQRLVLLVLFITRSVFLFPKPPSIRPMSCLAPKLREPSRMSSARPTLVLRRNRETSLVMFRSHWLASKTRGSGS